MSFDNTPLVVEMSKELPAVFDERSARYINECARAQLTPDLHVETAHSGRERPGYP